LAFLFVNFVPLCGLSTPLKVLSLSKGYFCN